ncbi:hypothetical protein NN561_007302 [Cricetulus griseus]
MAAITRPSGYCRKAERAAAGSARCGGGIRTAPEASGRERRPEGPAPQPQPHESRPWRRLLGCPLGEAAPWPSLSTPTALTSRGDPTAGGRAGRGHPTPSKQSSWPALADRKWPPLRASASPILANGVPPLLTRIMRVLVPLGVSVAARSQH